ncbi:LPXTG cell wall anchor domain-containing protein [Streptomyces sp. NBC_01142]|uniref:LAETG motif-containing sortase-dependent surface protein n=1 Tax=Streptomyces sp. NBC_01142 TaxID=2975865 RepID=UPI00224E95E9|nr:LAETG motif-containing sortase-dependent surface protein [Streptomyces sp. NBC_01142]MCX4818813.1 LPXTG cell wall anchor domain-containing protein [Streptomyces sp. NBC_01142]
MKLRRAMAVAAATAVIAPAAFLSAPAAYATETPTPSSEVTATPTAPEPGASTSPAAPTETATTSPSPSETATVSPSPSATATTSPSPSNSATTPAPSTSPSDEPAECETYSDSTKVVSELRGLPSKVVAGSGWVDFTYRVTNKSKKVMQSVETYVAAISVDGEEFEDTSDFLTLEWQVDGAWEPIDVEDGYFGNTEKLEPGEYADAKLRLKVDGKAPAGYGAAFTAGVHVDGKGNCEFGETNIFEFEILAAGSKPGKVDDAKGKPGKGVNKPGPQGGLKDLPVTGNLAETGSDSMVPTIGIAGGIAVVAGAGVVFAMKRRRSSDATA